MNHIFLHKGKIRKRKQNLQITCLKEAVFFVSVTQYCLPQLRILVLLSSFEGWVEMSRPITLPAGITLTREAGLETLSCELK